MVFCWAAAFGQVDTLSTTPTLSGTNGSAGVTFAIEAGSSPINILGLTAKLAATTTSANVWIRMGGVGASSNPTGLTVDAANGWTQVITNATVSGGTGTGAGAAQAVIDFGMSQINVSGNSRIGFHIEPGTGSIGYKTGAAADQVIFTDGAITIDVSDSVGIGGPRTNTKFNPRRFLGSVFYEIGVIGNCPPFTNFAIDSISATAAKVSWSPGANSNSYFLEYGLAGFTQGTGTKITGTYPAADSIEILTGLTANSNYDVYFGELCNSGNDSAYFPGAQSFKTTKLCSPPTNFSATNTQGNSTNLSWNYAGSATNFTILYGPVGGAPGAGGSATATASPYTLTGLAPVTSYDIYIFADCGAANGVSDTVGPISITTPCVTFVAPYFEDFDNLTAGQFGSNFTNCWTGTTTSVPRWETESSGTSNSFNTGPLNDVSGSGIYVYMETSGGALGDTGGFISPTIDISSLARPELSFFYHMYGATMGTLTVQADTGSGWFNIFSLTGEQQTAESDPWLPAFIDISGYPNIVQFKFLGTRGTSFTGDMSIDEVSVDEAPACRELSGGNLTVANLTDSSATVQVDNSNTAFELEWGPCGFTQGTGTALSGTGSISFSGLAGNTCYEYYVRKDCTADTNGFSVWTGPYQFITNCSGFVAPYSNNFDNDTVNVVPACWTNFITGGRSTAGSTNTYQFATPNSNPYHIRFYNGNGPNSSDTTLFITPRFDDLDSGNRRVTFFAKQDFGNGSLNIGTMSDPTDPTTYTRLDSIALTGAYQLYIVDITAANGYNGSDLYVAFEHPNNTTFDAIYIDDFNYVEIPACAPPLITSISVDNVTASTANVSWNPGDGDSTFVEWGLPGFTPGSGAQVGRGMAAVGDSTFTITGLAPLTTYEFYIQDSCSGSGFGPFVGPITFTTKCAAPSAAVLPLFDGFENYTNGPTFQGNGNLCSSGHNWSFEGASANSRMRLQAASGTTPFAQTGSQAVTIDHSPSASGYETNYLIMTVNLTNYTTSAGIELGFSYNSHGQDANVNDNVWVRGAPGDPWVQIYDLRANAPTSATYNTVSNLDIVGPITSAGQSIGAQTQIRFSQEGRFSANSLSFSDGYTFDDVSLDAVTCPTPTGLVANNVVDTSATLTWNAPPSGSSGTQYWFGPVGFFQGTTTVGGVKGVVSGNSVVVDTLSANSCYEFLVRYICGPNDTSVWAGPVQFCTPCAIFSVPYFENFDNLLTNQVGDLGNCWETSNTTTGGYGWRTNTGGTSSFSTGPLGDATSGNGTYLYTEASSGSLGDSTLLTSPLFDLSGQANPDFTFAYHMFGATMGTLRLQINDGTSWTTLVSLVGQQQTAQTDPWRDTAVSLSAYSGVVQFRFVGIRGTSFTGDMAVDDVRISKPVTCFQPINLSASNLGANSATLNWSANSQSTGNSFEISYGLNLNNPGLGTMATVTGTSTTITGLTASSQYCFYVRENCGGGDISFWAGPFCFNTLCGAIQPPYLEQFATPNAIPNCYSTYNQSSSTSANAFWKYAGTWPGYGAQGINNAPGSLGGSVGVDGSTPNDSMVTLESPQFDMSATASPYLEFKKFQNNTQTTNPNSQTLYVDVYDGSAWNNDVISDNTSSAAWRTLSIDLSAFTLTGPVQFRFHVDKFTGNPSAFYSDILVDDIRVFDSLGAGACPAPINVAANVIACDSVEITWNNSQDTSVVNYGTAGGSITTATVFGDSSFTIAGTIANTLYIAGVRNICNGDTSLPDTVSFNTGNTGAPTAAFTPTGNGLSVSFDASATTGSGNSYSWDFGDGNTSTAQNPTNVYATGGSFTICLTVTNACGTDSVCQTLANVSLAENALARSLSIFPNPTDGLVTVEFEPHGKGDATLKVTDARGRVLLEKVAVQDASGTVNHKLDLSRFAKGIYMIEITSGEMKAVRRVNVR